MKNRHKRQNAQPSHADIQDRRQPFGTVDPKTLKQDPQNGDGPHKSAENISDPVMKRDQAYRRITSGDHNKDHHVICFAQPAVYLFCRIYRMVNSTGCIQQYHCQYKNCQSNDMECVRVSCCFYKKRSGACGRQKNSNTMGDCAPGIF